MRSTPKPPARSPDAGDAADVAARALRRPRSPRVPSSGAPAADLADDPWTGWRARSVGDGTFDRPPAVDIAAAVVLGLAMLAEVIAAELQGAPTPAPAVVAVLLSVAVATPLAWRRVTPVLTMALSGTAIGVFTLIGYGLGLAGLPLVLALYSVAAYGTRQDARASLAITAGFVVAGFGTAWWRSGTFELIGFVVTCLVLVGVFALGDRTRARRQLVAQLQVRAEEAERHQRVATELAAADERRRIARELHDVVAHTVSVVVVQAGAGRRVAARDPAAAATVLADIEASGRDALAELRRLVSVLRDDGADGEAGAPQPTLEDVPALVARLAEAGVPVHLDAAYPGDDEVPGGVAVSAYRIVQESLTNVLKHAGPVTEVIVRLRRAKDVLHVEVVDDGRGRTPPPAPPDPDMAQPAEVAAAADGPSPEVPGGGTGTGLLGMRERAVLLGGSLQVGRRPEGGFRVLAQLPLLPAPAAAVGAAGSGVPASGAAASGAAAFGAASGAAASGAASGAAAAAGPLPAEDRERSP